MHRPVLALVLALVSSAAQVGAARADAVTTRIETRPYYGAIVTIEQGVRVWRALPPHDRIIIVPEGAGKVNINVDASTPRAQAAPVSQNVNINNSGNVIKHGGHGGAVVGVPHGHGHGHGGRGKH